MEIKGWESNSVVGGFILDKVIAAINDADIFLCDLTFLNENVLFELGYAITSQKPVWISIDTSLQSIEKFNKDLNFLTTIGYREYTNGDQLGELFLKDAPYEKLDDTLYKKYVEPLLNSDLGQPTFLYMKSPVLTDASNDLTKRLDKANVPPVTDNYQEVSRRSLEWYLEKIYQSVGVIIHFLDEIRDQKYQQNLKFAFIAGLVYGTGRNLLMLAQSPLTASIDFRDIILVRDSPAQCVEELNAWLIKVQPSVERFQKKYRQRQQKSLGVLVLKNVNVGEYVAEDEEETLQDYFIPTDSFDNAIKFPKYHIFVGRKGTGKTANLYGIVNELRSKKSHDVHICVIKPADWELEDLFHLFRIGLAKAEHSYLVEVLWKYLIFSEIAFSRYDEIQSTPPQMWTKVEQEFCAFVDSFGELIISDFTQRMERAIKDLCDIDIVKTGSERRKNISEILHDKLLGELRVHIGRVFRNTSKVIVLIDNLDKAWEKRPDLEVLSQFLFGLLNVGEDIPMQFNRSSSLLEKVDLSLIVFLRSDIFAAIKPHARERDRLKYSYINWNDARLLELLIERRFVNSVDGDILPEEIWEKYFCQSVEGVSTKTYIVQHVFPRPRDIIYFCKQARANAINHGNPIIQPIDILQAEKEYSAYCFSILIDEVQARFDHIEDLVYAFAGEPAIVTRENIIEFMEYALIPRDQLLQAIELLSESAFLGLETSPDNFEFMYDEREKQVLLNKSHKTAKSLSVTHYKINVPFHAFLGIGDWYSRKL